MKHTEQEWPQWVKDAMEKAGNRPQEMPLSDMPRIKPRPGDAGYEMWGKWPPR